MHPNFYAFGAIVLWATLAPLGVLLQHVPPFLLTGLSLVIGSVLALPAALQSLQKWRQWRQWRQWGIAPTALALGVFTFFGYHFFLFIALRMAPSVEVNLVNYLWPLLMVVLAPLYLPGVALRSVHWLAAVLGFAGAALAILGGSGLSANELAVSGPSVDATGVAAGATTGLGAGFSSVTGWGYALAGLSALIWANFSLQTRRAVSRGKHVPTWRLFVEFPASFFKAYVLRRHAMRGVYGFMTSMNYAFFRWMRVAKDVERRRQEKGSHQKARKEQSPDG